MKWYKRLQTRLSRQNMKIVTVVSSNLFQYASIKRAHQVNLGLVFDAPGLWSCLQGLHCVLVLLVRRGDAHHHECHGIPSQRLLKNKIECFVQVDVIVYQSCCDFDQDGLRFSTWYVSLIFLDTWPLWKCKYRTKRWGMIIVKSTLTSTKYAIMASYGHI